MKKKEHPYSHLQEASRKTHYSKNKIFFADYLLKSVWSLTYYVVHSIIC